MGAFFGFFGLLGAATLVVAANALVRLRDAFRPIALVRSPDGSQFVLTARRASRSELVRRENGNWELGVTRSDDRIVFLNGIEASRVLVQLLPAVRRVWPTSVEIAAAMKLVAERRDILPQFEQVDTGVCDRAKPSRGFKFLRLELRQMPHTYLLGCEMVLNEARERDILDGELQELLTSWREAERIATISDSLLIPSSIVKKFEELRKRHRSHAEKTGMRS